MKQDPAGQSLRMNVFNATAIPIAETHRIDALVAKPSTVL